MIKKIAITGPESTGKSVLAEQLAVHYRTAFVPEFAREYLAQLKTGYDKEDVIRIAEGQIESELQWLKVANNFLFCDTDLINIKIWLEHKYGDCPEWIKTKIRKQDYDFFLLTDIDLPWQDDPLREHPGQRGYFFEKFESELKKINAKYQIISGKGEERLANAIDAVQSNFC